jgi:hypothetical protein
MKGKAKFRQQCSQNARQKAAAEVTVIVNGQNRSMGWQQFVGRCKREEPKEDNDEETR